MGLSESATNNIDSPEWQSSYRLLCRLAQCQPVDQQELIERCVNHTGWNTFLRQLEWHRVSSLVWRRFKDLQEHVPADVYAKVRRRHKQSARRALRYMAALKQVVALFEAHQIRYLTLKGPVLSQQLYDNPCTRYSKDIDVIINEQDVDSALQLLRKLDYHSELFNAHHPDRIIRALKLIKKDVVLVNKKKNVELELHWRWDNNPALIDLSFDQVWSNHVQVDMGGFSVATLSDVHNLIYLSAHGSKSFWIRLSWLTDIDRLISVKPCDWLAIKYDLQVTNSKRIVFSACYLINRLLNTHIPSEVASIANDDKKIKQLVDLGEDINLKADYIKKLDLFFKLFLLNSDFKYFWCHFTRSYGVRWRDIKAYPLPIWLFPIYYFIRPISWLWRNKFNLKAIFR